MKRNVSLDALRGICALFVALYHYLYWTSTANLESLSLFGVYVFFVLSALTLMMVYAERFSTTIRREDVIDYLRNRFARIFPLLFLVSFIYFSFYVIVQKRDVGQEAVRFLLTGTGLFALHGPGSVSNTTGAWSLGIEVLFYILFPILATLMSGIRLGSILTLSFLVLGAQVLTNSMILAGSSLEDSWGAYVHFLSFSFYFAAGLAIYRIKIGSSRLNFYAGLAGVVCVGFWSNFQFIDAKGLVTGWHGIFLPAGIFLSVLLAKNSIIESRLERRIFEFLGNVSYACYLIHPVVYQLIKKSGLLADVPFLVGVLGFLTITLISSSLIYWYFELPVRNYFRGRPSD